MKDPTPLGELLDGLLEGLGVARPTDTAELVERWDSVAGEPFAERSQPVQLRDGELLLEVADGTTATLLRYHEADLVERLKSELGAGLVTTVRVRVARSRQR